MTRYSALLLDFGGVITRALFECRTEIEDHFGLRGGSLRWYGPLDPANDELWRALLDGQISDQDYWRRQMAALAKLVGRDISMKDVIGAICGVDPNLMIRAEAVELVRKAKAAGCRVGVLSNDLERIYGRETVTRLAILRDMDCVVDGSWTRVHKPSAEAYVKATAALGSRAEHTVFVDDQPRNVEGAVAVGLSASTFDICDPTGSFGKLDELLGL